MLISHGLEMLQNIDAFSRDRKPSPREESHGSATRVSYAFSSSRRGSRNKGLRVWTPMSWRLVWGRNVELLARGDTASATPHGSGSVTKSVVVKCMGDTFLGCVANFHLSRFRVCSPAVTQGAQRGRATMAISFKGAHFPKDIILMGVRWYVAYPLSYRHVEELMEERGVPVDHATIQRWVVKYSPQLEEAFHRRKRAVWVSWRMDETYIKVKVRRESTV